MHIRDERPEDVQAIFNVTEAAFRDMPYSDGDEQFLVDALRADNALAVSLVAELDGRIVGHIAFSRVEIEDGTPDWFDLGPVSVLPELHSQGIGSTLIREGLARITAMGAQGCVLLGYPSYYGRFGFEHDPALTFAGKVNPNFQRLVISGQPPKGEVTYHSAFYGV